MTALAKPYSINSSYVLKKQSKRIRILFISSIISNNYYQCEHLSEEKTEIENCRYADRSGIDTLNAADTERLDRIVNIYKKTILVPCTACHYCMPCPFGVNIPENFAIINSLNAKVNNLTDRIWRLVNRRKYRRLVNLKEKVNLNQPDGNAALCTACGQCVPLCPQTINIPEELKKVHAVLGAKKKIAEIFGQA